MHRMQRLATCLPPAIPFDKAEKKAEKKSENKENYKTFDIRLNKKEKDSEKVEHSVKVFEQGSPEDFCNWFERYQELKSDMPLDTPVKQVKIIRSILKGTYLEIFNRHLQEVEESVQGGSFDEEDVEDALEAVTLRAFKNDKHAYRRQVRYMRYQLCFNTTNFEAFFHRLKQLNKYLKYFPAPQNSTVTSLEDNDLIEIIDNAKPLEYNQAMLQNDYDPYDKSLDEFASYLERLEQATKFTVANSSSEGTEGKSKKRKAKKSNNTDKNGKELHKCKYCKKMVTHDEDDCWEKPGNENKKPSWMRGKRQKTEHKKGKKTPMFSGEQINFLIENAHLAANKSKKTKKIKKRKVQFQKDSSSEEEYEENHAVQKVTELLDSDDSVSNSSEQVEAYYLSTIHRKRNKRQKVGHLVSEVVGEIVSPEGKIKPIRCLLDSGTTATIVLKSFVGKKTTMTKEAMKWRTVAGSFKTSHKCDLEFKMPEFSHNKVVTWSAFVDDRTDPKMTNYDLIIGSDLMTKLKMTLNYDTGHVIWDDVHVPMKEKGTISDKEMTQNIYELTKESSILKMSEDRHNEIIKAMYGAVDIRKHVQTLNYLTKKEQDQLATVLEAYPDMYEGTIGTLNIPPVHFELKKEAIPYHAKPFPIPKAYENLTKDECKRFEKDKIWHHTINSVWAAPSFIVPKKTGDVRVVTDFRELNKWIIRKPYPIPKILDILQRMKIFKYSMPQLWA